MDARSGRARLPREVEYRFWDAVRAGLGVEQAAARVGVSVTQARRWLHQRGGVMPSVQAGQRRRSLGFAEREEIALLRAQGRGVREIAREMGRSPSSISRELKRVKYHRGPGNYHRVHYRASTAQADADKKARRPKAAKLATNLALRREVQKRLEENHSPEQIAARLVKDHRVHDTLVGEGCLRR